MEEWILAKLLRDLPQKQLECLDGAQSECVYSGMTGPEITSSSGQSHQKRGAISGGAFSQSEVTAAPVSMSRPHLYVPGAQVTNLTLLTFYRSGAGLSLNLPDSSLNIS